MDISNVKDKIVYVASPYAGDIEKNVRYAQDACRAVLLAGAHPYAPPSVHHQHPPGRCSGRAGARAEDWSGFPHRL